MQPKTLVIKQSNPFDNKRRETLLNRINNMNATELQNMEILLKSSKANAMIAKPNGLSGIKLFL